MEIRVSFTDHREPKINLNKQKLLKYKELFVKASEVLHVNNDISLESILNEPGVIEFENDYIEDEDLIKLLDATMQTALDHLNSSLEKEAEYIRTTINASADKVIELLIKIEKHIDPFKEELFSNMNKRIHDLLQNFNIDNLEQRLFQELAIYIDKYDIHEELSRIRSHIGTLKKTMDKAEDNGKSLNFVLQELQREANTLGSKFSTAQTFPFILSLKEEIEKCREMVQNVA